MARPRRGKRRRNSVDWLTGYLLSGIEPEKSPDINIFEVLGMCIEGDRRRAAWEDARDSIMQKWNLPGCRPFAWWVYDAPRLPIGTFPGCYYDGKLPEPRRYLSGAGKPRHEQFCYAPSQHFGIWSWYGDPDNPPKFETQFDYLKRHGLLLPGEDEPLPERHSAPPHIEDAAEWEKIRSMKNV